MRAIFVRPRFDAATEHSHLWCSRLMAEVVDRLEGYVDLEGERATRANVEKALIEDPAADLVFYDHGDERGLVAQGGRGYVIDDGNLHLLRGRVVYTLACLWGSGGGARAYTVYGAKVVVCYVKVFAFTPYDEHLFCRCANSGYIAYAKGERDWARIKKLMIEEFDKAIEEARDPWTKLLLLWDRDALRVYADGVDRPEPRCPLRRLAVRLLGKLGWRLSRRWWLALVLFGAGLGTFAHDRVAEWVVLGCRIHGLDVGFALVVIAFILASLEVVELLKR
ncbi:MAG: hypothetical protein QW517_10580 [Thermofilaceae archaeon]